MEKFKIDYYNEFCSGNKFPEFEKLSKIDCDAIKKKIQQKTFLTNDLELVNWIRRKSIIIDGVNADSKNFSFKKLLFDLQILAPNEVFINWNRYDSIDKFTFSDFDSLFEFIWYPGPDDIDVFPESMDWIISIDESGSVYLFR